MRIFYLILCFICLCDLLHAQTVRISYEGDPLTDKAVSYTHLRAHET